MLSDFDYKTWNFVSWKLDFKTKFKKKEEIKHKFKVSCVKLDILHIWHLQILAKFVIKRWLRWYKCGSLTVELRVKKIVKSIICDYRALICITKFFTQSN